MTSVPTSPLAPAAEGYSAVYDLWVSQGSTRFVESQASGWLREAIFPNGGSQPTFLLVTSSAGVTSANLDSSVTGYGYAMATEQGSWAPRGALPKTPV